MNTPNTEITKFKIIVIEWLRNTDRKTGQELYNDVLKTKEIANADVSFEYYSVTDKKEFASTLAEIADSFNDGEIATLQIESHGSEAGIGTSANDIVTWQEFYDLIRPINIKMGGLLFVCLSMCVSYSSLSSIKPKERAPYLAMIATTDKMYPDDLYNSFVEFYTSYNNILDIAAFKKMAEGVKRKDGKPAFIMYRASDVFDKTFDMDRDPQNTEHLVNQRYVMGRSKDKKYTKEQARKDLAAIFNEAKSHRDYFCFQDILKIKEQK